MRQNGIEKHASSNGQMSDHLCSVEKSQTDFSKTETGFFFFSIITDMGYILPRSKNKIK